MWYDFIQSVVFRVDKGAYYLLVNFQLRGELDLRILAALRDSSCNLTSCQLVVQKLKLESWRAHQVKVNSIPFLSFLLNGSIALAFGCVNMLESRST